MTAVFDKKDDVFRFSSGREVEIWRGLVSVTEDGQMFYGHDGKVSVGPGGWPSIDPADVPELCDMMIARWTALRDRSVG